MATSWEHPMCLIRSEDSGHLEIDEETAARLGENIRPLVVVGIAGLYRTGKSYILNLLAGKTKGFCLGSTVQSCTKGIWVWLIDHPTKPGLSILLMDTEGLGDVEKGDAKHDVWIFCLAVLLSSIMVYNSKGSINTDAISKLHFVTKMADNIKVKASMSAAAAAAGDDEEDDDSESLKTVCPVFIWAVRDFTLDLEDKDGQPITSDEYLKNALKPLKGKTTAIRNQNACRESLRDFFSTHKCFVFPIPVSDSSRMKELEKLTEEDLAPGFQEAARELREYVYSQCQPKKANDIPVTGKLFVALGRQYVDALLKGAVPCIQNAVDSAAEQANNSAISESMKLYNKGMERTSFPTESRKELDDINMAIREEAVEAFSKAVIFDGKDIYLKKLHEKLGKEYESYCRKNEDASDEKCQKLLCDLSEERVEKVKSGHYAKAGGYDLYEADWNTIKDKYRREPGKGLAADQNWAKFEEDTEAEKKSILASDKNLTATEKKVEEERLRADESERNMKKAEREKERSLEEARKCEQEIKEWEAYIAKWNMVTEWGGKAIDAVSSYYRSKVAPGMADLAKKKE